MSEETSATGADGETTESAGEPASLVGFAWKLVSKGPRFALDLAQKGLSTAERLALSTLRKRMDAVVDADERPADDTDSESPDAPAARHATPSHHGAAPAPLNAVASMARLLDASQTQTATSAREALALRMVKHLVPDEARILAALSDGHSAALMHLGAGPMVGPATQRWLENLSPVGKEAGVALIDRTSEYIGHLRELGLLESGEEDKSLQLKYQILEADTVLRKTSEEIEKAGLRPKLIRRTIRMTELGKAFWLECAAKEQQSW